MTDTMAPDGLVPALRSAGLVLAGPVGRGSGGARWSAQDETGNRWTVTLIDEGAGRDVAHVRTRVERLREVRHDHLARHGRVLELAGGRLAVLQEEVPGADLATVCAARGAWAPAEVVTILVPLAGALAALHSSGLTHGDVSAANVILRPDGRAVLVDLVCGADRIEAGTPGVAAPERPEGPGAPGDVHALARLGLQLLQTSSPGPAASEDEASGQGGRDRLARCLERATSQRPAGRPDAAHLAEDVYASCPPAPVDLPDAAVLARAALRGLAEAPVAGRTTWVRPRPERERGRHRRRRRGRAALTVAGLVAVLGAVAVGGTLAHGRSGPVGRAHPDPVVAAVGLTLDRADALASGDLWALRQVTVPGSRAARSDLETALTLQTAGGPSAAVEPQVEVLAATRLPTGRPAAGGDRPRCPGCARVLLTARFEQGGHPPDEPTVRTVVLVVRPTMAGWRVSDVEPAPG